MGFGFSVCLFWRGRRWKVLDSDSGGGRPAWFSSVFLWVRGRQARGSRLRASLPPVFQFLLTHSEGWGARFLTAVAGLWGSPKGTRRGRYFQGRKGPRCLARRERGSFGQGSFVRSVPLRVVDLPSPDGGSGKGYGTRWGEEMAPVACAAGLREGRWDGLGS